MDQQMPEALKKLKKTRDLLTQMYSNYEEALAKVKGMNFLTKPALKEKEKALNEVEGSLEKVKKFGKRGKCQTGHHQSNSY